MPPISDGIFQTWGVDAYCEDQIILTAFGPFGRVLQTTEHPPGFGIGLASLCYNPSRAFCLYGVPTIFKTNACARGICVSSQISLSCNGDFHIFLDEARQAGGPALSVEAQREIDYLENNRARMDYPRYRNQGWFIGSGVVEAGCKHVLGQRLKQSGMFWTEAGATAVLHLRRALLSSGGWNHLWSQPLPRAA